MDIRILDDATAAAEAAAEYVADATRSAAAARGRCTLAVSGGRTPGAMFAALATLALPWDVVHVYQVDERVAPAGHADRNVEGLAAALVSGGPLRAAHLHAMPVEADDLHAAARAYASRLAEQAGSPPVIDLVHLGMGSDGHTASLVPGDPVLAVTDRDVAITERYQGRRRLTLTYPVLARARERLWLVTGADKAPMLRRLRDADDAIPAGRLASGAAVVFADRAAARSLNR